MFPIYLLAGLHLVSFIHNLQGCFWQSGNYVIVPVAVNHTWRASVKKITWIYCVLLVQMKQAKQNKTLGRFYESSVWYKTKFLATKFGGRLCRLPKLVAKISSKFQHLVNTGLDVGSLIKWLSFKVANTCKLDIIWVVYCSPIVNGFIRL